MNWQKQFEFRKITDPKELKAGMKAKLVCDVEKTKWSDQCWIVNCQDKIFTLQQNGEFRKDHVSVLVPWDLLLFKQGSDEGVNEDETPEGCICVGNISWFEYND